VRPPFAFMPSAPGSPHFAPISLPSRGGTAARTLGECLDVVHFCGQSICDSSPIMLGMSAVARPVGGAASLPSYRHRQEQARQPSLQPMSCWVGIVFPASIRAVGLARHRGCPPRSAGALIDFLSRHLARALAAASARLTEASAAAIVAAR
jgi:hypothetical protein